MKHDSTEAMSADAPCSLEEIRREIDGIDPRIRDLLMKRLACSHQVAAAKNARGETSVHRPDRECAILEKLGADVPENLRPGYLAVVRKIMETSRMYQYGLLYQWNKGVFSKIPGSELASRPGNFITLRLSRPDRPNSMSEVLSMIGDYGFDMDAMTKVSVNEKDRTVTFDLTIRGDLSTDRMKTLVFQLSKESEDLRILERF